MTVTYDSYESKEVQASILMLAASTTFQTLVDHAGDSTATQNSIIEMDGGNASAADEADAGWSCTGSSINFLTAPAWAHVRPMPDDQVAEYQVPGAFARQGSLPIRFYIRAATGIKRHEQCRRMLNLLGLIAYDLRASFGTAAGFFVAGGTTVRFDGFGDPAGWSQGLLIGRITINWKDLT